MIKKTATGPKSVVAVLVLVRDKLVGVATLSHPEPMALTEEHLNLFQAIADQAGVAVLNARLYDESRRQARVMTALAQSAKAMTSSIHLEQVLNNILKQIQDALQVDAVALALVDHESQEMEYEAVIRHGSPVTPKSLGKRFPLGKGIIGWVAKHRQRALIPDVSEDPRYDPEFSIYPEFTPTAIACAPVRLRGDVIGAIEAILYEGAFGPDALMVLSGISNLAGSSIQNARLFEELQVAHNRYHD
ncbi:MAG: hypothetical protein MAG431_00674 [Chloroflexi bacterium]|nr:hypothetical protein [Chloroflexota bacterium]